jgi:hypothetical protein
MGMLIHRRRLQRAEELKKKQVESKSDPSPVKRKRGRPPKAEVEKRKAEENGADK